jgi:hypothetical protein
LQNRAHKHQISTYGAAQEPFNWDKPIIAREFTKQRNISILNLEVAATVERHPPRLITIWVRPLNVADTCVDPTHADHAAKISSIPGKPAVSGRID